MPGKLGRDVALTWGAAEIPGARQKGVAFAGEPIDLTADEDNGWQVLHTEAGQNAVTITVSGVDKAAVLRADMYAGTRTKAMSLTYPDSGEVSGTFFLATYNEGLPYNEAATFEATFQSTGPVTYDAPTG